MNLDEARGRVQRIARQMDVDQAADPVDAAQVKRALRVALLQHADVPPSVATSLANVVTQVESGVPAAQLPANRKFSMVLRKLAEQVEFQAEEGFNEAAWFGASTLLNLTALYLDQLDEAAAPSGPLA